MIMRMTTTMIKDCQKSDPPSSGSLSGMHLGPLAELCQKWVTLGSPFLFMKWVTFGPTAYCWGICRQGYPSNLGCGPLSITVPRYKGPTSYINLGTIC